MKWLLIVTAVVNGQPYRTDPVPFPSKEECLHVLKIVEQHPQFKQYGAKASCEKTP
jgi:hypothetical protein